jgi:hypothetical protein
LKALETRLSPPLTVKSCTDEGEAAWRTATRTSDPRTVVYKLRSGYHCIYIKAHDLIHHREAVSLDQLEDFVAATTLLCLEAERHRRCVEKIELRRGPVESSENICDIVQCTLASPSLYQNQLTGARHANVELEQSFWKVLLSASSVHLWLHFVS